jgi:hypothetical protein
MINITNNGELFKFALKNKGKKCHVVLDNGDEMITNLERINADCNGDYDWLRALPLKALGV